MEDLAGRVAVITGGAGGVGRALAARFGREGMRVVLADVVPEALDEVVAALSSAGVEAKGVVTDVSDHASVEHLADAAYDAFGAVHLLCNNAGVGAGATGRIWEHTLNDWGWGLAVNLWGVIHGIKAFVPRMLAGGDAGHVVNTSSGNGGIAPLANTAVYATTKAAVTTVSEVLYGQLRAADSRIGVSVLFPGPKVLKTGLLTSARNRPPQWLDATPVQAPASIAEVEARLRAAGVDPDYTPVEDVAEEALAGIRAGRFWILPASERTDDKIRARAASMLERAAPVYMEG